MFRMMCKDLRISPLRTFLTGLSMFIGIVAMIAGVLVGTLGREFLLGVNTQIFGYTPTYALSISGANFADSKNTEKFLENFQQVEGKAFVIEPKKAFQFASIESAKQFERTTSMGSVEQIQKMKQLYKSLSYPETVYTTPGYNDIYNMPLSQGRWFDKSGKISSLEVVLNKPGYSRYRSKYVVSSHGGTLNLTPFNVVGVVNDGKDSPILYVNIKPLVSCMPSLFATENVRVYWHNTENLSIDKMRSHMNDILHDTVGGEIAGIERVPSGTSYHQVLDMLQLGLVVSAALLLFVAVLGQINIGLSSLEQRTYELLVRRALGASKYSIVMLVLSSLILLSIIVCVISVLLSIGLVHFAGLLLAHDSPIASPAYPVTAALIAVVASVLTALLGGFIPAIKAFKLEPALALR